MLHRDTKTSDRRANRESRPRKGSPSSSFFCGKGGGGKVVSCTQNCKSQCLSESAPAGNQAGATLSASNR